MLVNLEKQIEILRLHPDFNEVVRNIDVGPRTGTLMVQLHNGNWFELEFDQTESGQIRVKYWNIPKPDKIILNLLDWLKSKHTLN